MSDFVVQETAVVSTSPDQGCHPVRDLIDCIRENHEMRKQARQERRDERRDARFQRRHCPDSDSTEHQQDNPIPKIRLSDNIPRPLPDGRSQPVVLRPTPDGPLPELLRPMPPRPSIESRTSVPLPPRPGIVDDAAPPIPPRPGIMESSEPQAKPFSLSDNSPPKPAVGDNGAAPGSDDTAAAPEQDRITERVLPDTITVKERDGSVAQVVEQKDVSADVRLNAYLQSRGSELTELDLNGSSVSDKGLSLLRNAPNLHKLLLNDTDVTNDSMKVLAQQGLKNLQDLNLHSTKVGDEGVAQLKDLPLKVLNIADTATSDDCMKQLKAIQTLQVLNADYSGVGNESVKMFKEMPNLRSVSLKGCPITDDCVKDLAKCQNLMLLNLEDTKLSSANVAWLQRQMPRCLIMTPDGLGAPQGAHEQKPHRHAGFFQRLFSPPPPPPRR